MRLLKQCEDGGLTFETFVGQKNPPLYAILSHTWINEEVLLKDIEDKEYRNKQGFRKIQFCIDQARRDGLEYCWVDTCCIDKTSSAELSEAINSMFRWYQTAAKCYAYLEDIHSSCWEESFGSSRWFKRGWTLQELIAPQEVGFFSQDYVYIGCKMSLAVRISGITKVPVEVLHGRRLSDFRPRDRIAWMGDRETQREEDIAYSLLGILDVSLPPIYGEGKERAMMRLWEAVAPPWQTLQEYPSHRSAPSPRSAELVHQRNGLSRELPIQEKENIKRRHDYNDESSLEPPSKRQRISLKHQIPSTDHYEPARTTQNTLLHSHHEQIPREALSSAQRETLLDSLRFKQMDARQMTIRTAHANTCRWLLKQPEYLEWLDVAKLSNHHGFLWMKGKPGTGKSTLMKFVLNSFRKSYKGRTVVSFFFNARGSDLEKSTIGMYRSLLLQLMGRLPQLQSAFESVGLASWNCSSAYTWTTETLKDLFQQTVQSLGQNAVVCFIDALDECDEDQIRDMVAFFQSLGANSLSGGIKFQVFFSSRHYPHITISRGLSLVLEGQEGHNEDITRYIDATLKIGQSPLAKKLRADLHEKSSGVFMWIVLVVDILNKDHDKGTTMRNLQRRLQEIPADLHHLFRDILTRDSDKKDELLLCIQWVLFARQPLAPEQLYFAILSGTQTDDLSAWDQIEIPLSTIERFLLNSSKGLTEVTRSKIPTVQFIHESVRDFLLKDDGLAVVWPDLGAGFSGRSHERLKECCIIHLSVDISSILNVGETLPKASSRKGREMRENLCVQFPFFQYAVENTLWHAEEAERGGMCQKEFLTQFDLTQWLLLRNAIERYDGRRHTPTASLLYLLGEYNLPSLIRAYNKNGDNFNVEKERYGAPILAALACGSQEAFIAMSEVQGTACQNLTSVHGLAKARSGKKSRFGRDFSFSNKRGVISYLAEAGEDTALRAALTTPTEAAEFYGGSAMNKDNDGRTPLSYAAAYCNEASVQLLLAIDQIYSDTRDKAGRTPLSYAAESGNKEIVQAFLAMGQIDIDCQDKKGRTPLSWAAGTGHEGIVRQLLDTGQVDINYKDNEGRTPFSWAAGSSRESAVRWLLDTGQVDIDSKDNKGRTPLSWAAGTGHEGIVRQLPNTGQVDIDSKDNKGRTPLSWAARFGGEGAVRRLLDTGQVDIDSKDSEGRTPLSWAARFGGEGAVRQLLDTGQVDVDFKDNEGRTPLSLAARSSSKGIIRQLLDTGQVEIDSKDNEGRTPLS